MKKQETRGLIAVILIILAVGVVVKAAQVAQILQTK